MFERRLKIFLGILVAMTVVLVLRAAQVQVLQKEHWRAKAMATMTRSRLVNTFRGRILDAKGEEIAVDRPCIDACIHFRAMWRPPETAKADYERWTQWIRGVAIQRVQDRLRDAYATTPRAKRRELIGEEVLRVQADIEQMWSRLAEVSRRPLEEIEATRDEQVKKVLLRRRFVWYRNFELAAKKYEKREPPPQWRRWLIDENAEAPNIDHFTTLTVAEEEEVHPILKAVSTEVQNELRKYIEQYPGLVLRPGVQRHYPYGDAGCHLIGHLTRVAREDLKNDPNQGIDELRQYSPNDLIGSAGIEKLVEPLLRGSRGKIETIEGRDDEVGRIEPQPGKDVQITIDIELQRDVINMFRYAQVTRETDPATYDTLAMHGAAVVIDLPTGEVLALASYPTFDLNSYQENYLDLVADELGQPLYNRATQQALVPGSTVKPVVGLAGIAERVIGIHDGIECNGFLQLNGKQYPHGRCWTQSMFGNLASAHHQVPYVDPHVGTHGNPTGHLVFTEAVQRSCNVYFETVGDRLKMDGLAKWYQRFGLGERTGIGIAESAGSTPARYTGPASERRFNTWIAAIGQGTTTATPIQMANVAATIARDGVWMRPRLISDNEGLPQPGSERGPNRVDLGLPPDAMRAAQEGMTRVVNTPAGSAYKIVRRDDLLIAGKTGTAQVGSKLRVKKRDENGKVVTDKDGRPIYQVLEPSSPQKPNPQAPWYRGFGKDGTDLSHSWFIGFAPADNPKVAFAVVLEYGGSGGQGAGLITRKLIESLIQHGYLRPSGVASPPAPAITAEPSEAAELLEPAVGD